MQSSIISQATGCAEVTAPRVFALAVPPGRLVRAFPGCFPPIAYLWWRAPGTHAALLAALGTPSSRSCSACSGIDPRSAEAPPTPAPTSAGPGERISAARRLCRFIYRDTLPQPHATILTGLGHRVRDPLAFPAVLEERVAAEVAEGRSAGSISPLSNTRLRVIAVQLSAVEAAGARVAGRGTTSALHRAYRASRLSGSAAEVLRVQSGDEFGAVMRTSKGSLPSRGTKRAGTMGWDEDRNVGIVVGPFFRPFPFDTMNPTPEASGSVIAGTPAVVQLPERSLRSQTFGAVYSGPFFSVLFTTKNAVGTY
ncbi:hypothetical protein MMC17_005331 [Xylographa soralifera]|nr:hypothetical protein [Xylographa soralifera]